MSNKLRYKMRVNFKILDSIEYQEKMKEYGSAIQFVEITVFGKKIGAFYKNVLPGFPKNVIFIDKYVLEQTLSQESLNE